MAETKICENCDKEVGIAEVTCPSCSVTFADLDDAVVTVERANKILEKRRAKVAPVVPPTSDPAPVPVAVPATKKESIFTSLGKVIKKQ